MRHKIEKAVFVLALTMAGLFAMVSAQGMGSGKAKPPLKVTRAMVDNLATKLKTPVSLSARDASLAEVISILAKRSRMNIVMSQSVKDMRITMDLRDTPLDEAINLVVRAAGLSYEIIGGSILIADAAKLKEEVGQTGYVVNLAHANAKEVQAMLKDLSKNIQVDEGGNRLVCLTSPRVINEIRNIVEAVDKPQLQVVMEVKLTEVNVSELDQIGVDWNKLMTYRGFVVEGHDAAVAYEEASGGGGGSEGGIVMPFRNIRDGISMSTWQRQRLAFEVGLDLLLRDGKANLLADCKVATMNNREARIHIGEKIPYIVSTITATGVVTKTIMKENTGVKLTLTPHVNESGDITVTLAPEVSSIIGWRGENQDIPLVKTREATSTIRVKDGQKIFLAGLLSEEISHDLDKVPILGSIPVVGRLFQRRVDVQNKTNLIIEVTPRIIYQ